jgi:hypothetical protein
MAGPPGRSRSHDDPEAVRAAEEREARERELVATNRRLELELRKAQALASEQTPMSIAPGSRKRTARETVAAAAPAAGIGTILTLLAALAKPVLETRDELARVRVEVEQSRRAIDAARAERTLDVLWKDYHRKVAKVTECRARQQGSALARLGFGLSNIDYSGVRWIPEAPGPGWKKTGSPAQRAEGDCPPMPEPPEP